MRIYVKLAFDVSKGGAKLKVAHLHVFFLAIDNSL